MEAKSEWSGQTFYYKRMGRDNASKTIEIVKERCGAGDIKKVFIFAATKQSVYDLSQNYGELRLQDLCGEFSL